MLLGPVPRGRVVLLDDVLTGGGHLTAATWALQDQGRTAEHAFCGGRTLDHQLDDPFKVDEEILLTGR